MNTKKLRQKILDLAIHGKLVAQNPNDEPASELLKRIRTEKEQLIKEGKIKKTKTTDSSHYENVPFEIPSSWEWCKLGDLAFYKKGPFGSSLTKSMFVPKSDNTYKVYEQKNAIQKDHLIGSYFISKEKYKSLYGFAVQPYDIIVSCAGTIGETYVLPLNIQAGIINQALMLIRLYCRDIERFYLLYFDYILKGEAYKESKGTAIKNIPPFDILKNFFIPLPPLEEQKRIVEAIDKWFALIDSIENNKADLETTIKQTKSKILDLAIHGKLVAQNPNDKPASKLLKRINPKAEIISNSDEYENLPFDIPKNWCWCKLSNISNIYTGNSINENEKKSQYTDVLGTEYIATKDVGFDNSINYKNGISIPEKYIKNFRIAPANSVLMCIEGGSAGRKIGILSQSVCFGNKLCCFSPYTNDISSMYIFYYLQSPLFFEIFNSNKNGIIGGVSINNLKKLLFPLPPLEEQKRIVEAIDKAFKYLDAIAESL